MYREQIRTSLLVRPVFVRRRTIDTVTSAWRLVPAGGYIYVRAYMLMLTDMYMYMAVSLCL